jgi:CheY-specific phosphatase CheX
VNAIDEFEEAREDLEALLIEVLGSVFSEEAGIAWGQTLPPGPVVSARLAIHDEVDGSYTIVEVRTSPMVARILASRMMLMADPGPDDLLDAMAELGNIAGGNVKSLLRHSCRLSLPTAEVAEGRGEDDAPLNGVSVQAAVLGQVVELYVHVADNIQGLCWPGASMPAPEGASSDPSLADLLEKQS